MAGYIMFLRRHVSCISHEFGTKLTGRLLVFFKWPITGILIEFVGFIGLFGYAEIVKDMDIS